MKRTAAHHERDTENLETDHSRNVGMSESEIDQVLADSFPASDAPPWTLGVSRLSGRSYDDASDSDLDR